MLLYFLHAEHCAGCKVAAPELLKVQVRRSDFTVIRREINAPRYEDERDVIEGWRPRGTPAYAIVSGGVLVAKHEGVLKQAALDRFLDHAKATIDARAMKARAEGAAARREEPRHGKR